MCNMLRTYLCVIKCIRNHLPYYIYYLGVLDKTIDTKQTTTRDFTRSVSDLMSSTGSIHVFPYVNSPDSVNKFGVSTRVYREIMSFPRDDTYQ